ncbi:hypothetical protein [Rickettsiella massiliensis]|uniref:hypothetical protein n=1 Tax=Rickettsiella massiliensis TaxID=676517 RepID=UPI00029A51D0|nr:hypothetical protein [Rickettsiella massiliensis]
MIKHDVLCVLLGCVLQHQETQETMEVKTLCILAQQGIAEVEQLISKTRKNTSTNIESGPSIWEERLKECLSDLSGNKETINIKDTKNIIQTKLEPLSIENDIDIIEGVLVNIHNTIKECFLDKRIKILRAIETSFKNISGKMQDIYRRLNKEIDQSTAVESLNTQNSEAMQKSDSFAARLEEAFTLFFEKKEWDPLGRGCLFFNKITPDGIVKIRNILKKDTNDTFNIITHEEKIFLICQVIKLKAHHSKSFSRRNDVHTQYQELDNLLSKTYHHLYPLNCLPEKSQLNTHIYNEENTRELLEYLTNTLPGQSSLPQPSRSP